MFQHHLETSAPLKPERNKDEAQQWLAMVFKVQSHLSKVISIMHLQIYAIGWATSIKIWEDASTEI
ncbi:hypothetical protein PAXRUDRAFT_161264 [Paxillus rubicundulus Ve08.2h10]|uniref:Uncharacterized protein n=1 Tax=Paxillus rubicundulus Ve08.2h10 TaxID=930991 RepID=A0A0D0D730_9AGAM|nr:hypothetical protein PAXRUDRAFT_161264 [Paxillus rubicundulus Ve08.2h10]